MTSLPLAEWDYSLFDDLQQLLARVVTQPTTSLIRRLDQKLDQAQPWLLALTQLPGPTDQAKQNVENSEWCYRIKELEAELMLSSDAINLPSGNSTRTTGELLSTSAAVSNYLSVDQLVATVLTIQAESQKPRYPSRQTLEVATYILHDWTAKLLDCLRELLHLTISPDAGIGPPFDALREWVNELLVTKTSLGQGRGEGALVDQIITQIDDIQAKLNGLVKAPRTSGPEYDLLSFRVGALRAEQGKLAGTLGDIAEGGLVGRGHVIKLLKWLKKCDRVDALVGSILSCVAFVSPQRVQD